MGPKIEIFPKFKTPIIKFLHHINYAVLIILSGEKIIAEVIGKRENRRNNGLEVPALFPVKGPKCHVEKAKCILDDIITRKKE